MAAKVRDATRGRGADVVIVAAGSADLANLAMRLVRPRGRVSLFAGFPAGHETTFDLNALHYGEVTVTGAFGLALAQFKQALNLIARNQLPLSGMISHRLELDDVMAAFELAEQGLALKVAVVSGSSSSS
jgi:L-iditol 2-dehydrogenase